MPKPMERPTFRKLREHQHLRGTECTNSSSKDDGHMTGTLMKIKARDKQIHRTASALIDPSGHAIEASSCPVRHGMAWHQPPELLHRCCCAENTLPATLMLSCILFALWRLELMEHLQEDFTRDGSLFFFPKLSLSLAACRALADCEAGGTLPALAQFDVP